MNFMIQLDFCLRALPWHDLARIRCNVNRTLITLCEYEYLYNLVCQILLNIDKSKPYKHIVTLYIVFFLYKLP